MKLFSSILLLAGICVGFSNAIAAETPAAPAATTATPAAQTTATPSSINGQVQVVQPTAAPEAALTAADYLDIQYKSGDAKHKLREYTVTLNNKQAKHIEILQVEITNGLTEQAYTQLQQEKSQAKRRVAGGLLRGVTGIATSFVPYAGMGSYAAYQGINAGSYAVSQTANMIENSQGSANMSGRILQRASNILISPKQQFQCLAVVPETQQPLVKVIFKDMQNNQIFDLQK